LGQVELTANKLKFSLEKWEILQRMEMLSYGLGASSDTYHRDVLKKGAA
jgi:hypothetical protein